MHATTADIGSHTESDVATNRLPYWYNEVPEVLKESEIDALVWLAVVASIVAGWLLGFDWGISRPGIAVVMRTSTASCG